jgi:ribonucleoside-diphosphate reductase beta chain
VQFAEDLLGQGVSGMSPDYMREYLQHMTDQRLGSVSGSVGFDDAF